MSLTTFRAHNVKSGGGEQDDWQVRTHIGFGAFWRCAHWVWGVGGSKRSAARLANADMAVDTLAAQPLIKPLGV